MFCHGGGNCQQEIEGMNAGQAKREPKEVEAVHEAVLEVDGAQEQGDAQQHGQQDGGARHPDWDAAAPMEGQHTI
jgi:hypothetical protein